MCIRDRWHSPDYVPLHATRIIGEQVGGTTLPIPTYAGDTISFTINTAPTIIRLADNPCVDHVSVPTINAAATYSADSTLSSTAVFPSNLGDTILFQAGQMITLDTGFHHDGTSNFQVKIEECVIDSLLPLLQNQAGSQE